MRGLLLVWTGASPTFTALEAVDHRWQLGREHPAWPMRDDRMSRRHCEVEYSAGTWSFCDLGSANASRLDGHPFADTRAREHWRLLQLGRSLIVPCQVPVARPAVVQEHGGIRDLQALERAAWRSPRGTWREEIPWWVHHVVRLAAPITVDVDVVAACLLHDWDDRCELVTAVDEAICTARDAGSPCVRREHLGGDPALRTIIAHAPDRRIDGGGPGGPSTLNRLRDRALFVAALARYQGDHGRAAASLQLSAAAFERWLRRHGLAGA